MANRDAALIDMVSDATPERAPEPHFLLRQIVLFWPVALLVFAVMAFGTTQSWSIFVLRVGAVFSVLLWGTWQFAKGAVSARKNRLYAPAAAFLAIVAIQLCFHTSAYAYATKTELLQYLTYAALLFVICEAIRDDSDYQRLLHVMAAFGFVLAIFALVQGFTAPQKLYWTISPQQSGWVYGPYVNRNHYAGIVELLMPAPFVLAMRRGTTASKRALFVFAGIVIAATAFTCQSRAGMICVGMELIFLAAYALQRRKNGGVALGIAASATALVLFLTWLGGLSLFERFQQLNDTNRLAILKDSFAMIRLKPLMGWGAGTFPEIYPHFRSFYTDLLVNQAHNDVLQLLIETGVIGLAVGIWFVWGMYRASIKRLFAPRLSAQSAWMLSAVVGCSGILLHSLFDFNLHIAANAAWFYVLASSIAIPEDSRV